MRNVEPLSRNSPARKWSCLRAVTALLFGALMVLHPGSASSQPRASLGIMARPGGSITRNNSGTAQRKPGSRTLTVDGQGTVKTRPDLMIASFVVNSNAPSAAQCSKLQAHRIAEAVSAIKAKLGNSGTVQTSGYSLNPRIVSEPLASRSRESNVSWIFSLNIKVTADNINDLAPIYSMGLTRAPDVSLLGNGYDPPYRVSRIWGNTVSFHYNINGPFAPFASGTGQSRMNGKAKVKHLPFAILAVNTSGSSASKTVKLGIERTHEIRAAIEKKLGSRGKVSVTLPDTWLHENENGYRPVQRRFRRTRTYNAYTKLTVKTERLNLLGALVRAGISDGASQVNSVTFTLSDAGKAQREAIADAARNAQSEARTIANSMGVKLGKILSISTNAQVQPGMIYRGGIESAIQAPSKSSAASIERSLMPVIPRQVGVSARLNIVYQID